MGSANRVVDRVRDMADVDLTGLADGDVLSWDAAAGKFVASAPPAAGDLSYEHDQASPSASWSVTHNLGKRPSVAVATSAGDWVVGDVHYVDGDSLTISFSAAFAGKAFLN